MLTGGIGCGKSTVAKILSEEFKYQEIMFAGPIKEIGKVLGFPEHQMYGTQEQKLEVNSFWGVSGRRFLQVFGSEVMRDALPRAIPDMNMNGVNVWARIAENQIGKHKRVVVSDGRFEDEAVMVKRNGGIVVRVERTHKGKEPDDVKKHKSEHDIIEHDYIIDNNGSVDDLRNAVKHTINLILKKDLLL